MAHVLILGMTESGKTTLARKFAHTYHARGIGILILDPLCDPRWPQGENVFITADQEEFLDVFWRSRRCAAFLDEGGESVGRYNVAMSKTATRGRHWGHSCHFIAQRATQLAPLVRDQCSHLFLFCSSWKDGKLLAEEFNKPELEQCSEFAQGEYIHAVKFGRTIRVNQSTRGTEHDATIDSARSRANRPGRSDRTEEGNEGRESAFSGTDSDTGTESDPDSAEG